MFFTDESELNMTDKMTCPVCNGEIEPGENVCRRCGFRLAGQTQSFKPVKLDGESDAAQGTDESLDVQFSLYVTKGPQTGEDFFLDRPKTTLGRDPHCDIFLNDMTVSREHAIITVDGDNVMITDDGSLNGTWVDGSVVDSAVLHAGSLIQIGTFNMVLQEHKKI